MKSLSCELDQEREILLVKLSRPEKRNAFDAEMCAGLTAIFRSAVASDPKSPKVIVLRGEGASFCSGADLGWLAAGGGMVGLAEMYECLLACEAVVVACAHGEVRGGGVGLLAACDLVLSDHDATFALPEASLGLFPGVLSPFLLRKIGYARFLSLALTGRVFNSSEAAEWGLVSQRGSELEVMLEALLSRVGAFPRSALTASKRAAGEAFPISPASLRELARRNEDLLAGEDARSRILSFLSRGKE